MGEKKPSVLTRCREAYTPVVFTRADLRAAGYSGNGITAAVRSGQLIRLRRDRYVRPDVADDVAEAVRIGGVLSCVSWLKTFGVFVLSCTQLHVHVQPGTSRLRPPKSRSTNLHWNAAFGGASLHAAGLQDAVREAITCQTPRAAVATLDSVLHHGLLTRTQLEKVFVTLPQRFSALLALVDATAASGPETFMRLILRGLGLRYETQVSVPGVGYVDFVVEGWLIIECDSKEWHEGWEKQVKDRRRDLAAAKLGYVTLRPLATDIMHDAAGVRASIAAVVAAFGSVLGARSVHNSATDADSARKTRLIGVLAADLEEL